MFELLQYKQILLYNKNSLKIFLIFLKNNNNNIENIIENSEKNSYNINKTNSFIKIFYK